MKRKKPETDEYNRPTLGVSTYVKGNSLFDRAIYAVGLDGTAVRHLLTDLLRPIGSSPEIMTPDELGALLPTIDKKIRQVTTPDIADTAMARLRQLLLSWED